MIMVILAKLAAAGGEVGADAIEGAIGFVYSYNTFHRWLVYEDSLMYLLFIWGGTYGFGWGEMHNEGRLKGCPPPRFRNRP